MVNPSTLNYLDDTAEFRRFMHWLHGCVGFAALIMAVGMVATRPVEWHRFTALAFLVVVLAASEWQVRRSPARAAIAVACGVWLMTAGAVIQFAGIHSANILIFPFVIALAGWVLGTRWLVGFTVATLMLLLGLGLAEVAGLFQPTPRAPTAVAIVLVIPVILVISFLTYAARQSLLNSRNRAVALSIERARQVEEIAARERELELLLNNVPAAVASFDRQTRLVRCNQRYADLFGKTVQEFPGLSFKDYLSQAALDQVLPYWESGLTGIAQNYRRSILNPVNETTIWVDVGLMPEVLEGRVVGIYCIMVDVTERVNAEAQIRSLNTDLERRVQERTHELAQAVEKLNSSREELASSQAKATLSALVASVAHELSTPIGNSVLLASTFADLARQLDRQLETDQMRKSDLVKLSSTLAEGGQILERNLERANVLLRNFRQVSADQASEQRRNFDLATVVAEVLSSMAPSLRKMPHKVIQSIPSGILMDSHPGPLGQVLINLINNACLHAFDDRSDGLVSISAAADDKQVVLVVEDNGRGIAPEALAHLFRPFYSTKVGQGGTGLGMTIVDNIVSKTLGGKVQVHSELGKGTRIEIVLPLTSPPVSS